MIGVRPSGSDDDGGGEPIERPGPKTMKPAGHRSPSELRRSRDLLYLYLKHNLGLDAVAISRLLQEASRSPRQIRSRINEAAKYYRGKGLPLPRA
jgi:hypothetical protein